MNKIEFHTETWPKHFYFISEILLEYDQIFVV